VNEARTEILEIDLHLSADGVIVLHHDAWIHGTNPVRYIKDMTVAELKTIDAGYFFSPDGVNYPLRGAGLNIPTLAEVLDEFLPHPTLIFFFDIKSAAAVPAAMQVVQQRGMQERVIFGAVDRGINQSILSARPAGIPVAADARTMLGFLCSWGIGRLDATVARHEILGFFIAGPTLKLISKELFKRIHDHGRLIAVFGPLLNEPHYLDMMHDWKADFILSDRADVWRTELDRLGKYTIVEDGVVVPQTQEPVH